MNEGTRIYVVVQNEEEEYSVWPAVYRLPQGWHPIGAEGSLESCLQFIAHEWKDMRPASVRAALRARGLDDSRVDA